MASGGSTSSSGQSLADRYAVALYSLADERRALDEAVRDMAALGAAIDASPELRGLLSSPMVEPRQAGEAVRAVLAGLGVGRLVQDLVGTVAANRRLGRLREIVAAFAALAARRRGVIRADVGSAHPLGDVEREQLRARLIEAGYGQVEIVERVDPSLLGGLVVRVGANVYDTTLKSRLQRLGHAMKGAA